jgi:hypothetical protein
MGSRSPFPWQGKQTTVLRQTGENTLTNPLSFTGMFESSNTVPAMMTQEFSPILPPVSESSVSPQSVPKMLPTSPSRGILTPEQRELKKQRDRARRGDRITTRIRGSSSSSSYMGSPPMTMSDVTSTMSLPVYSTAPQSISLLSESAPSLHDTSYLPPFSPHMQEPAFAHT